MGNEINNIEMSRNDPEEKEENYMSADKYHVPTRRLECSITIMIDVWFCSRVLKIGGPTPISFFKLKCVRLF